MPRRWALVALWVAGCTTATTALELNVRMDESVVKNAAKVRLVVSAADSTMFPMVSAGSEVRPEVRVRNFDLDGDGQVDIVIEFSPKYAFARENRFRIAPGHLSKPLAVGLRVDVLDAFENHIARLGGPDATQQRVSATLLPGQVTQV